MSRSAAAAAARPSAAATNRPAAARSPRRRRSPPRSTRATRRSAACTKGIEAEKDARQTDRLDVLPAASGAYVEFAATPAEAQGRQIRNEAPGAEVIGPHLLTVGRLSDDQLRAIETCLQAQGSRY